MEPSKPKDPRVLPWVLLVLVLSAVLVRLGIYHGFGPRGTDDQYYYAQARSLLLDQDLDLRKELGEWTPRPENVHRSTDRPWNEPTPTGRVPCKYPIGAPLLELPFLLLGQLAALLLHGLGFEVGTNGYSLPCYLAWSFGNLFYAVVALAAVQALLCRSLSLGRGPALSLSVAAFFGSPLIYQTIGDPYMAHVPSAALVSLLVLFSLHPETLPGSGRARGAFLFGLLGGLALITRPTNLVYLPVLAFLGRGGLLRGRLLAWAALGCFLGSLPQMLAWKHLYGVWILDPYEGEGFDFTTLHLLENTLHARAGLFAWNPLWLPSLLAFLILPAGAGAFRLSLLALLLLVSAWWCHWWGDTYGGRAFSSLLPLAALGLGSLYLRIRGSGGAGRILVLVLRGLVLLCLLWSMVKVSHMERLLPQQRAQGEGFPRAFPFR